MRKLCHRHLSAALAIATSAIAAPSAATVLTFDWTRDPATGNVVSTVSPSALPSDYGDFVTGASAPVLGGAFLYAEAGEGYTPNIAIEIRAGGATPADPRVELWALGFGDLANVVFGLPASSFMEIVLTADPGFEVELHGFDLGGYPGSDWVINSVDVFGAGATLFSQADVLVEGSGAAEHTGLAFPTPIAASHLVIRIDYANLQASRQDNIGLDNLRFGQNPRVIPEPAPAVLLSAVAIVLARLVLRQSSTRAE